MKNNELPGLRQKSTTGPVECLGVTFPNEEARRAHFTEKLREKLKDPAFRKLDGFPMGNDEDILRMSDPPYYTACPNPFVEDFVRVHGRPYNPSEPYHREPFAVDVSEGKTDALYTAHGYHTKVPHLAIVPSILHYSEPGDLVLDGFCGSGMTGVAANWCGTAPADYRRTLEMLWQAEGHASPKWGARRAILGDLSPAATFITAGYNAPLNIERFERAATAILAEVEKELGWMYDTLHADGRTKGRINYTIWSEVFSCPQCGEEIVFYSAALDKKTKRVHDEFPCPGCAVRVSKDNLERTFETLIDPASRGTWKRIKLKPVLINYSVGKAEHEKAPDATDLATLSRIEQQPLPSEVPTTPFPIQQMYHGSRLAPKGFTHVHHLYMRRAACALAALWARANSSDDSRIRNMLLFMVEQGVRGMSLLNRYKPIQYGKIGGSQVGLDMPGVYYVSSISTEVSPWYQFNGKLKRLLRTYGSQGPSGYTSCVATTSTTASSGVPENSVDYIFTDPPFGENIPYADLNFLVEAWHRVFTTVSQEAIVDHAKKKDLHDYQELMRRCFGEYHRVLKPGRWMTVVFSNSKNAVWNAIQEAMFAAGFVVADVRTLDKQQGSYRQVTSSAVKQDLVISAYRPSQELEERLKVTASTGDSAWEFVRAHLHQVPVFSARDGRVQVLAERQAYVLYDRAVAFHVQRGYAVPLSSAEFHAGLRQRFPEREGMYFLSDQATEFDHKRLSVKEVEQYELFVSNEKSAIQWVRRALAECARTYQDLQPLYMREAQRVWEKHEQPLELSTILRENFVQDSGGTWRAPDPQHEGDLEQLRRRHLLKEFEQYVAMKGKLKIVRAEALRAGFKECWQKQDFKTIVEVAKRVPDAVIEEDPALLMFYDIAQLRVGD